MVSRNIRHETEAASTRTSMNIAITGSHGLVGSALVPLLKESGHCVSRLVRATPRSADEVQWNPEADEPIALPLGTEAVIHLTGANIAQRWTPRHKSLIRSRKITCGYSRLILKRWFQDLKYF
jgi:NAD dependent epimerase/dehydratase family enzyme